MRHGTPKQPTRVAARVHDASTTEPRQSLDRVGARWAPDAIAERLGCSRSQWFRWRDRAEEFPVSRLATLARLDPDPSFLDRLAERLRIEDGAIEIERAERGDVCVAFPALRVMP